MQHAGYNFRLEPELRALGEQLLRDGKATVSSLRQHIERHVTEVMFPEGPLPDPNNRAFAPTNRTVYDMAFRYVILPLALMCSGIFFNYKDNLVSVHQGHQD